MTACDQLRPADIAPLAIHHHRLDGRLRNGLADASMAVRITDQHHRPGVLQIGHQLAAQAKAVQRHRHCAKQGNGSKSHGPFGTVAHGNRHPVAGLDAALLLQTTGQCIGCCKEPVKGPSILAIDHELGRTMNPAGVNYLCQILKGIAIGCHAAPIGQRDLLHFKRCALRSQLRTNVPDLFTHRNQGIAHLRNLSVVQSGCGDNHRRPAGVAERVPA